MERVSHSMAGQTRVHRLFRHSGAAEGRARNLGDRQAPCVYPWIPALASRGRNDENSLTPTESNHPFPGRREAAGPGPINTNVCDLGPRTWRYPQSSTANFALSQKARAFRFEFSNDMSNMKLEFLSAPFKAFTTAIEALSSRRSYPYFSDNFEGAAFV